MSLRAWDCYLGRGEKTDRAKFLCLLPIPARPPISCYHRHCHDSR